MLASVNSNAKTRVIPSFLSLLTAASFSHILWTRIGLQLYAVEQAERVIDHS
jgi:hypothetical protein